MCRLLLVVDDSEQKLLPLVSARRQNKRGQLFGLSKGERLHGFGVAWLTGRAAGAVVTTRPPSDDLNVRRVLGATSSRLALAFIRSCACDRCPATTLPLGRDVHLSRRWEDAWSPRRPRRDR